MFTKPLNIFGHPTFSHALQNDSWQAEICRIRSHFSAWNLTQYSYRLDLEVCKTWKPIFRERHLAVNSLVKMCLRDRYILYQCSEVYHLPVLITGSNSKRLYLRAYSNTCTQYVRHIWGWESCLIYNNGACTGISYDHDLLYMSPLCLFFCIACQPPKARTIIAWKYPSCVSSTTPNPVQAQKRNTIITACLVQFGINVSVCEGVVSGLSTQHSNMSHATIACNNQSSVQAPPQNQVQTEYMIMTMVIVMMTMM